MKLEVVRTKFGKRSTLGKLYVNDTFACWTLEDVVRRKGEPKVHGETAIPTGTYRVTLRKEGGFHARYTKRFPKMHKGMLWVRDVPGFEYILIHCGNTHQDTRGCLLVGMSPVERRGEHEVGNSVGAYQGFYPSVAAAIEDGKTVTITVVGEAP
jgi:hypothetical protein